MKTIKLGDVVTPISMPELKSRIKRITVDHWAGETLYILENGTAWTKDELEK